ncbi:amino acid ABC transporter ATP-binding protein [Clostridiaceae bacterium OF09-1]|nr:amino acid ABC transporter ATP-binding protein [Clostridiaceae bacterium OF09-1]
MIEVKNITKSYGDLTVLKDFSVDFDQSGVTVLLGPSGTGKSTLLRCINGLEKTNSGDILVDGLSVNNKKNLKQIRTTCGMVFQHTVIFPHMNVLDNLIMSPMKLLKMPKAEAVDKARFYLEKVGLSSKEKSRHNELSGGEQQRIAIARALMMNPKALLLDEITSALDPEMTREVLNILESLAEEGVCMLCVTHEMTFAKDVASRIIFMEGGKMVCDASKEEFFGSIRKDNERINKFLSFIGE